MSKRNRYKKTHKATVTANISANREIKIADDFNPASDLKTITIVISLCVGLLVGLYFYDKQTGILQVLTEKLAVLF